MELVVTEVDDGELPGTLVEVVGETTVVGVPGEVFPQSLRATEDTVLPDDPDPALALAAVDTQAP